VLMRSPICRACTDICEGALSPFVMAGSYQMPAGFSMTGKQGHAYCVIPPPLKRPRKHLAFSCVLHSTRGFDILS
jgi:hypothetical protein